jgi:soluble lytic murein transglycosylase
MSLLNRVYWLIFVTAAIFLAQSLELRAGTLAEDSLYIAAFHDKIESGDSAGARALLVSLSENPDDELARKANFLLAKMALDATDYVGVHEAIALGTPEALSDWATYFDALAYEQSDQPAGAATRFACLAADSVSILAQEALWHLATLALDKGYVDSTIRIVEQYRLRFPAGAHRQEMELLEASARVLVQDYAAAVECIYRAELQNPTTDAGRQAELKHLSFKQLYAFEPRPWTPDEIRQYLDALTKARAYDSAMLWIDDHLSKSPPPALEDMLLYWKGIVLAKKGNCRAAIATWTEHQSNFPQSPYVNDVLYRLGRAAFTCNNDSLAMTCLALVADRKAEFQSAADAFRLLAVLCIEEQDTQKARTVLEELVAFSEGHAEYAEALWRLGWILWDMSLFSEAEKTWTQLSDFAKDSDYSAATLYWRARALEKMGKPLLARGLFRQTYSRFPYSYYGILAAAKLPSDSLATPSAQTPCLEPLSCEENLQLNPHWEKFCLLEHLRLSDLALQEWPAAKEELGESPGLWWRQTALLQDLGKPMQAWQVLRDHLNSCLLRADSTLPELFWRVAYPLDFDDMVKKDCAANHLDVHFMLGLICQESHFQANAASSAGAIGLMQLMPNTARRLSPKLGLSYSSKRLADPEYNIALGAAYFAQLLSEFNGDSILALAAYNAGESRAQAWDEEFGGETDVFVEHIPFRETRLFIKRIVQNRAAYRRLYPNL